MPRRKNGVISKKAVGSEPPPEVSASAGSAPEAPGDLLQIWEFENAPDTVRRVVPFAYAGGWVLFARPGHKSDVVEWLISHCHACGYAVSRHLSEDGGVVLAGLHQIAPGDTES